MSANVVERRSERDQVAKKVSEHGYITINFGKHDTIQQKHIFMFCSFLCCENWTVHNLTRPHKNHLRYRKVDQKFRIFISYWYCCIPPAFSASDNCLVLQQFQNRLVCLTYTKLHNSSENDELAKEPTVG
jgi:hypothetical protein